MDQKELRQYFDTQLTIARTNQMLSEPPDMIEEIDNGAGTVTTYVGYAGPGTLTTSNDTRLIMKLTEVTIGLTVTTTKLYSNACLLKNVSWVNRASLVYGYLQKH